VFSRLPGLNVHCVFLRHINKCPEVMRVRDVEEFAALRAIGCLYSHSNLHRNSRSVGPCAQTSRPRSG
jgi:hypothetical protein